MRAEGPLHEATRELGLDGDDFARALAAGTYTAAHQEALRTAAAHRVRVAPTLLIGERHRIEGVPDPARIREAVLDVQAGWSVARGAACGIDGC
ncbi:hypothetical protein [Streptomyces montanisoli]|uniref:DSBA-like thioredoxin domain-containing protein n=1 Tax=Streptomyces montanisoli TaxID=2798581 RepID=A0A940RYF9_9ACTN|nr:hypothetical protein [Streptomyces montanisoli]MBP0461545.1 hypothetical protein [Streptomyces montanisoli]